MRRVQGVRERIGEDIRRQERRREDGRGQDRTGKAMRG